MIVIKTFCDHCGKELDEMTDYTELDIEAAHFYQKADLCTECFGKLREIIVAFCEKGATDELPRNLEE